MQNAHNRVYCPLQKFPPNDRAPHLTNRQIDVLHLLQDGLQNTEIAEKLFISVKTVDHHISSILSKLGTNTRTKAVSEAKRLGILP